MNNDIANCLLGLEYISNIFATPEFDNRITEFHHYLFICVMFKQKFVTLLSGNI